MKYLYYPGCTLHEKARAYDASGRDSAMALGIDLEEMPRWSCCGTVFPLTRLDLVGILSPVRTLADARRLGHGEIVTLCTFCYNVLKRTNHAMRSDEDRRRRINAYLEDEVRREGGDYRQYAGEVRVLHLLEVLRDRLGFHALREKTLRPLEGLRVAPYYGCLLLRPGAEMQLDDPEHPTILEEMLEAIGCTVVDFPHKVECCGSYLGLSSPEVAIQISKEILEMARGMGADALALACPLCAYNLADRQKEMREKHPSFEGIPVVYFTELLGMAMKVGDDVIHFEELKR